MPRLTRPITLVRAVCGLIPACLLMLGHASAQGSAADHAQGARSGIDRTAFDHAVRPQDDFYDYVNGTWMAQTEIPPGASSWNMVQEVRQQVTEAVRGIVETSSATGPHPTGSARQLVADFFRSYMDSDRVERLGIEPIEERIEEIRATRTTTELLALGARMMKEGVGGPLDVQVVPDLHDSSRYVATLNQRGLTLPGREVYLTTDDEGYASLRDGFVSYAERLFALAGIPEPRARASAVLDIEAKLAAVRQPVEETRDVAGFNPYAIGSLGDLTSGLDWNVLLTNLGLDREERIVISAPAFVTGLGRLLVEEPLDHWHSYWTFQMLNSRADLLPEAFVQTRFDFMGRQVRGLSEQPSRSARAIQLMSGEVFAPPGVLEWPISELYVERHLSAAAKRRLETMVEHLRAAYGRAIDDLDWMSDDTRAEARRKLENLYVRVGYPEVWPDSSALEITPDDLLGNVRRAFAHDYERELEKLTGRARRSDWANRPHWMYALADLSNAAEFPAAFLQPPLFDPDMDDAYNYAGVGFVIGHELGHNFDNQGRLTDAQGQLRDWWTEADEREFERRADRLVEYFSSFEPLDGIKVNGKMTLGENIADLAGLTIAYDAYRASLDGEEPPVLDGFTGAQRFLITYARVCRTKMREPALRQMLLSGWGAPWKLRVNGPLRHLPAFYDAFDVREGDGMWLPPNARVKIW